jgi:hypothetical protein
MARREDITGRGYLLIVEALTFTIEAFSGLPIRFRPKSQYRRYEANR